MVSSRASLLLFSTLSGLLVGSTTVGCADPQADYEAFNERVAKVDGLEQPAGDCATPLPAPGEPDGDFLMALSAKLNPTKPIMFIAKVTTTAMGDGLDLSMSIQPLSAADRETPVGDVVDVGPFHVGADAKLVADLPPLSVTGEANPLTGSDIQADVALSGNLCSPGEFICGDVTGEAIASITVKLDGSTFTMQKITDPAAYPDIVINCAEDPAAPLE